MQVYCDDVFAAIDPDHGLERIAGGNETVRNVGVALVLAAALVTTVLWGASPLARDYTSIWPTRADAHTSVQQAAIDLVPKDAAVSAPYNLVPHLTHRAKVYEFPVPWCNINWGVAGENLDDPAGVEWLILDRRLLGDNSALADDLLSTEFTVRFESLDIVVAERTQPAAPRAVAPPQFRCEAR